MHRMHGLSILEHVREIREFSTAPSMQTGICVEHAQDSDLISWPALTLAN